MAVVIETTLGDLTVDLYTTERPRTCLNFLKLCKLKYYNLNLFHKVEQNFVAQSGDPSGTGRGGESMFSKLYGDQARYFEMEKKPRLKHLKLGTLSMVGSDDGLHGSQFIITLGENLDSLDGQHSVFGCVAEGFETLERINAAVCDGEGRPYQDIRICHTVILHDPFDDPAGLELPDASPEPTLEMLRSDRIGAHEVVDDTQGRSMEEIEEEIKAKEARARATVLEMIGDLPDAEAAPPENVLFVCKLNPVTTDEDLEIIFSRFGPVKSCEVIRDRKTGDSLQYAFVEFEQREHCENAFFKMDNVLIDDRRIHVDFSQSVAKLRWKGKGRGVEYINDDKGGKKPRGARYELKDTARRGGAGGQYDLVWSDDEEEGREGAKQKERSERSQKDRKKESHNDRHRDDHRDSYKDSRSDGRREDRHADSRRGRHEDSHTSGHRGDHRDQERRSHRDEYQERSRERDRRDERREKDRSHKRSYDHQSSSSSRHESDSRSRSKRMHHDR
ncbi:peptidyl-prolyl cis-trans isomerase sig-7 isoform X2 [Rhipicephalus sanguineus]|uniref:peptidyl-prolyl cis-trans isomerase sig-7 isoform X2 n=1 Tax=Rhipicephalus sanguineus TaxID=34632 RepID=UPI0020C4282F|nr:peptidyl-prolyl cis-trans isomerase sig-7 isoform X2 [Rhipicephalus sanguineus]